MITDINSEDRLVKALLMEPSAFAYSERHDNIETIYKKLQEKRDTADVTELLKALHRIVNEATVEETFTRLLDLASRLDAEERRAAEEGLSDDELALFDLLFEERISKVDRERLKQASKTLLASLEELLRPIPGWTQNTTTQAEVRVFILDNLWRSLPRPPFTDEETEKVAERVYDYVWQRSPRGHDFMAA